MKYGYYEENESPLAIKEYTDGAHIIVLRKVNNFISTSIKLEDEGWELRDSIKVILQNTSLHATLFRKPFKGTVANNVLENGCGGINIDVSRITYQTKSDLDSVMNPTLNTKKGKKHTAGAMTGGINRIDAGNSNGRFPANLILIHPNCQKIGVKTVKGTSSDARKKKTSKFSGIFGEGGVATGKAGHGDENGNEIIINYDCVTDCPIQKLDTQSGITKAVKTKKSDNRVENNNQVFGKGLGLHNPANSHKDSGGASRYFKQVHSLEELKEYLTTLIRC